MLSMIVAASENNAIGKYNELLWHLPKDLKYFKEVTSGHCIIMGRKTFDSIGKPLPKRRNIVITRREEFEVEGVEVANDIEAAIDMVGEDQEPFIVGGGTIYEQALHYVNRVYLTRVHAHVNGDTFFPELDLNEWQRVLHESHKKDAKHAYDFSFEVWDRKKD
ncbi:MAG: dihydrofolate reductase [Flavobacteriales bacterium]|nr:dihydrofolate reductase [Flavobacteriales bacterium]